MKGKIEKIKRFTSHKKSQLQKDSQKRKNQPNLKIHEEREINLIKRFKEKK